MGLRRLLERRLSDDTKDAVKLTTGFLATMAALVLGLLISSAKGTDDSARNGVIEMAGKVAFLDRVLAAYGPEAAGARSLFRSTVEEAIQQMWPKESDRPALIAPDAKSGYAVFAAIQRLAPHDDVQRSVKAQATSLAIELGQLRSLLLARSTASISKPMLIALIYWLTIIFLAFSLLAPNNATATLALVISALSVSGAALSDHGVRPALWRLGWDSKRADARRLERNGKNKSVKFPASPLNRERTQSCLIPRTLARACAWSCHCRHRARVCAE